MRYMTSDDIAARLRLYANASIEGSWSAVFRLDLNIAADQIERLRIERDEARVDACRLEAEARSRFARMSGMSCYYVSPKQIAKERDWNCFDSVPAYIKAHEVRGDVAGPEGAD